MVKAFDLQSWINFCQITVSAQARHADTNKKVIPDIWNEIADHGFLRIFHEDDSGKLPVNGNTLYQAMEALAEACASTFWTATISSALCGRMITELCDSELRDKWVPALMKGSVLGCFAATERGSGSDPSSYKTAIRRQENKWILTGEKTRVTNAPNADVAVVLSNVIGENGEKTGLALVVLDLQQHRVTRVRHDSLGLRGMTWGTLQFDSLQIEDEAVITGITMAKTLQTVEWGQVIQTLSAIGLARAALKGAEAFMSKRPSFGKNLSEFDWIKYQLKKAHNEIEGVRIYARKAIAAKSRGELGGERVVISKILSTEASVRACEIAMKCGGGWGYSTELELERYLRDAYGNIPAGLPNDRLRELLICPKVGVDPWKIYC